MGVADASIIASIAAFGAGLWTLGQRLSDAVSLAVNVADDAARACAAANQFVPGKCDCPDCICPVRWDLVYGASALSAIVALAFGCCISASLASCWVRRSVVAVASAEQSVIEGRPTVSPRTGKRPGVLAGFAVDAATL